MAPLPTNGTFLDLIALRRLSSSTSKTSIFTSLHDPPSADFVGPAAFGGVSLALALTAAHLHNVDPAKYHPYSMVGGYLGPALVDRPVKLSVESFRDTRTFATRFVRMTQIHRRKGKDGKETGEEEERTCMTAIIDFIAYTPALQGRPLEDRTLLVYSTRPDGTPSHHSENVEYLELVSAALREGRISESVGKAARQGYALMQRFAYDKPVKEGQMAQNLRGYAPKTQTTHDKAGVQPGDLKSWDWFHSKQHLDPDSSQTEAEKDGRVAIPRKIASAALFAFFADQGMGLVALTHNHLRYTDAQSSSSLDFALRWHVSDVDLGERWYLRELRTPVSAEERTLCEGRWFDEKHNLVATMSQACALRAKKEDVGKFAKL